MKQRVMIAIALAGEPDLLIADEPTTALDVTIQAQVLDLMKDIQKKTGMAIMLITHDLGIVADMADHVAVMYAGEIVELRQRSAFYDEPMHPYSRKLFRALPSIEKRSSSLEVIPGNVPSLTKTFTGCRFADRCSLAWEACSSQLPEWVTLDEDQGVRCLLYDRRITVPEQAEADTVVAGPPEVSSFGARLLQVDDLKVHFPIHKGLLKRQVGAVYAVDGVSLELKKGQTLALVGESGCGKTTAGKGILQLLRSYTNGKVLFEGTNLCEMKESDLRSLRSRFQIIFQDPYSSMNPRMRVRDIIEEGMLAQGIGKSSAERQARVEELMQQVGMQPEMKDRYPHEFSGGQRQRICIARALAVDPRLIICDEPTSALDVSVQAQILNLLGKLQRELGLSYLFITHDLSVVSYLAHEIAVMYLGRIVEQGDVEAVLNKPRHPYTQALLSAVPEIDASKQRQVIHLQGDLPSPSNPPKGCHFHPRCPEVMDVCRETYPAESENGHMTRCHLYT
jgi:peptide/nickel transport system ATP-binding protein